MELRLHEEAKAKWDSVFDLNILSQTGNTERFKVDFFCVYSPRATILVGLFAQGCKGKASTRVTKTKWLGSTEQPVTASLGGTLSHFVFASSCNLNSTSGLRPS